MTKIVFYIVRQYFTGLKVSDAFDAVLSVKPMRTKMKS